MGKKKPKIRHTVKLKRHKFARQGSDRIAVLRPKNPQKAIAAYKAIDARVKAGVMEQEDVAVASFEVVQAQPHTFVGLLAKDRKHLLDVHGHRIRSRQLEEGDAYLPYEWLAAQHAQHEAEQARKASSPETDTEPAPDTLVTEGEVRVAEASP